MGEKVLNTWFGMSGLKPVIGFILVAGDDQFSTEALHYNNSTDMKINTVNSLIRTQGMATVDHSYKIIAQILWKMTSLAIKVIRDDTFDL